MSAAPRVLAAGAVLGILLLAGHAAVTAARIDEAARLASRALASWKVGEPPPAAQWESTWRALEGANALDPREPLILELMGLAAARRFDDFEYLRRAPGLLAQSLALRPASPGTWASLAEASYLAGDTTARFETALATAARTGPSHPHVQRMVAYYGLAVWDDVAPSTRVAIESAVAAGMRRNPLEMLQIAGRRDRLAIACRHISAAVNPDPGAQRSCPRRETAQ